MNTAYALHHLRVSARTSGLASFVWFVFLALTLVIVCSLKNAPHKSIHRPLHRTSIRLMWVRLCSQSYRSLRAEPPAHSTTFRIASAKVKKNRDPRNREPRFLTLVNTCKVSDCLSEREECAKVRRMQRGIKHPTECKIIAPTCIWDYRISMRARFE